MTDYRGTPLKEGYKVAIYWGYNELQGVLFAKSRVRRPKLKFSIL